MKTGVNPNQELERHESQYGLSTPLQLTCFVSTTALLLNYGTSINVQAGEIGTALHAAIRAPENEKDVARLLISRGADVNASHWRYDPPLGLARAKGD